jgi:hypothetical protein
VSPNSNLLATRQPVVIEGEAVVIDDLATIGAFVAETNQKYETDEGAAPIVRGEDGRERTPGKRQSRNPGG